MMILAMEVFRQISGSTTTASGAEEGVVAVEAGPGVALEAPLKCWSEIFLKISILSLT